MEENKLTDREKLIYLFQHLIEVEENPIKKAEFIKMQNKLITAQDNKTRFLDKNDKDNDI